MKTRHVHLKKVEVNPNIRQNCYQVTVRLGLEYKEFIGIYDAGLDDPMPPSIVMATIAAVNQALLTQVGITAQFTLRFVRELKPNFLDNPLFVVIVDGAFGENQEQGVGMSFLPHRYYQRAFAEAALEAINPFVNYLLNANDLSLLVD